LLILYKFYKGKGANDSLNQGSFLFTVTEYRTVRCGETKLTIAQTDSSVI